MSRSPLFHKVEISFSDLGLGASGRITYISYAKLLLSKIFLNIFSSIFLTIGVFVLGSFERSSTLVSTLCIIPFRQRGPFNHEGILYVQGGPWLRHITIYFKKFPPSPHCMLKSTPYLLLRYFGALQMRLDR